MAIFDPSQRPQNRPKKGLPGGGQKVTKNLKKTTKSIKKIAKTPNLYELGTGGALSLEIERLRNELQPSPL